MRTGKELIRKRGIDFFKKEVELLRFQRSINFISTFNMFLNMIFRGFVRIQIPSFRSFLYKVIRRFDR